LSGAQRDPDSDLVRSLAEGIREHAINTGGRKRQCQAGEERERER
jgi:hypothetical protein